jgi:hypothetical protein
VYGCPVSGFSFVELSTTCPEKEASARDPSVPNSSAHTPNVMNDCEANGSSSSACASANDSGESWMSREFANAAT